MNYDKEFKQKKIMLTRPKIFSEVVRIQKTRLEARLETMTILVKLGKLPGSKLIQKLEEHYIKILLGLNSNTPLVTIEMIMKRKDDKYLIFHFNL